MRLKNIRGRLVFKNCISKKINWNGKSRSNLQFLVKQALYPIWGKDVVFEEFPCFGTKNTIDFFNATRKIAIEVQGAAHTKYIPHFHKNEFDYLAQINRDNTKRFFCEINGIKLIEVFEEERNKINTTFLKHLIETHNS